MEENKKSNQEMSPYMVPASIVVAGLLIAGALFYSNSGSRGQANAPQAPKGGASAGEAAAITGDLSDDDPALGNPEAPVTVVEFGDFQCPFCGRFFQTVESQLIDKYVKTGKVKFVFRDFAFLGAESEYSSVAAECANEQGKFWQYHDYLYSHQQGENKGAFSKANLKNFAKELNLNTSQFNSCLDTDKYLEEVKKDTEDGRKAGVNGTPATFVNGRLISGAVPFAQFETVIEDELKKVK